MRGARLSYIILFLVFVGLVFSITVLSLDEGFINDRAVALSISRIASALIVIVSAFHCFLRIVIKKQVLDYRGYIAGVGIALGSAVLAAVSTADSTIGVLLALASILLLASSYPLAGSIVLVLLSGISSVAAELMIGAYSDIAVTAGAVIAVLFARVLAGNIIDDWKQTSRLFNQARWAASELSNVVMRLEETVHRARIYEITKERKRVAREVHDTIGYGLTGLIVQIGVVSKLVENHVAQERLNSLEEIARKTLQEVRQEVSVLRQEIEDGDIESWRQRWIQACDYFSECTGVRVDRHINENLEEIPKEIGETYYRIIQEGLTNAYRHGKATTIDISMVFKSDIGMILFRISDNGDGVDKLTPGNGMNGMRERIEKLGGTMVYDSRQGKGFDLGVDVPWPQKGAYGTYQSTGS